MQVVVIYNSKKKCLEVKGSKRAQAYGDKPDVLKRTHALHMGDVAITKRALTGCEDLDEIHSLEKKKSSRPKWKHQVGINKKRKFVDLKTGKDIDQYHTRVFVEDCKMFVL